VKLPRDISGAEAVRALRRFGFEVVRQEGSHIRMSKGNVHVTVPNHRQLVPKTLQSIYVKRKSRWKNLWSDFESRDTKNPSL